MSKRRVRKRRLRADFLNRYVFASAGLDTINTGSNTFKRIAPGFIENLENKTDKVTEKRIAEILCREEKSWKKLLKLS